jgi:transcriptional regulator with XRE-family HTH domain
MNGEFRFERREVACAFGATLRSAREELGISQVRLARLCDVDRSYPSQIERGERQPTVSMLLRLASGLGVNATALIEGTAARLRGELPAGVDVVPQRRGALER